MLQPLGIGLKNTANKLRFVPITSVYFPILDAILCPSIFTVVLIVNSEQWKVRYSIIVFMECRNILPTVSEGVWQRFKVYYITTFTKIICLNILAMSEAKYLMPSALDEPKTG